MSEPEYFTVMCPRCKWIGLSKHAHGGNPIADTGDFSELLCPNCLTCEGVETVLEDVDEEDSQWDWLPEQQ